MRARRHPIRVMERRLVSIDDRVMNPSHDPRPASRYQAVTTTDFREATTGSGPFAGAIRASATGERVLRQVASRVVRLDIGR
jgi:hypothetical protein